MSRPTREQVAARARRGQSLAGMDLAGLDLSGLSLRGADLRGTNLTCADLRGTNLTCADLTGADLTDADTTGTNFQFANIQEAIMKTAATPRARHRKHSAQPDEARLYQEELTGVAERTGFTVEELRVPTVGYSGERNRRQVAARHLVFQRLAERGLDHGRIAAITGADTRTVQRALSPAKMERDRALLLIGIKVEHQTALERRESPVPNDDSRSREQSIWRALGPPSDPADIPVLHDIVNAMARISAASDAATRRLLLNRIRQAVERDTSLETP